MSDQNTSLPVRTEADADQRIQSKLVDYTDPSGVDAQLEISEKLAHVRAFGQNPAGTKTQLKISERGYANGDGLYDAANNTIPASAGLIAHSHNATPTDADQTLRVTAKKNTAGDVRALDVALRDENGEAFTNANPLPVFVAEGAGTETNDYKTAADIAAAAADNHDYTVVGTPFLLKNVWASASGRMKVEIQVSDDGTTFNTIAVGFNSTANPNLEPTFGPREVPVGGKVRVIRTNLDKDPMDVYSTIVGVYT